MCVTPDESGDRSVRLSWVLGTLFASLSYKRHVGDIPGASVHMDTEDFRLKLFKMDYWRIFTSCTN